MDKIKIRVPAKEIYLKSLRLLSASIASNMAFDIEDVEDIRVLVSEACNYKLSDEYVDLEFLVEKDLLTIIVCGKDRQIDKNALEIRNLILESLADEVEVLDGKIKLTKRVKNG